MTLIINSRASWGAKPATGRTDFGSPIKGIAYHWEGTPSKWGTIEDSKATLRQIQATHMANKVEGYNDIAYNFAVDYDGNVFECRGWANRGGANGTTTANKFYLSIAYLGGVGQPFTVKAQEAIKALRELATQRGIQADNLPHSAFRATVCPGNEIRNFITTFKVTNPTTPIIPPSSKPFPLPAFHYFGTYNAESRYSHSGFYWESDRPHIMELQKQLNKVMGSNLAIDGLFGKHTEQVAYEFQIKAGFTGKLLDKKVGALTWAKLFG